MHSRQMPRRGRGPIILAFPIVLAALGAAWLIRGAPLHAQDRAEALAVVDKAIKAHGGAEALAKASLALRTGSGVMTFFGKDMNFTDEVILGRPRVDADVVVAVREAERGGARRHLAPLRAVAREPEADVRELPHLHHLLRSPWLRRRPVSPHP